MGERRCQEKPEYSSEKTGLSKNEDLGRGKKGYKEKKGKKADSGERQSGGLAKCSKKKDRRKGRGFNIMAE